ncbi:nucleotidyltransferase domain-containing protein [Pragia fontium]|uniref:Nucleotidyltransferase domain-containing protein n=1 Tax=Pragia fontium DSM 5563 = ATCC 49100 TaxID=1122977 RepID=A0AAJ4W804_9GAMM|nr:nucleotidyltransferase domain-containing protein [Pragia fontium]SFC07648.1 Nucleotidyltransferase domain-containing protein [Pragia fontium DSM 5563 = ATCC 49100]
MNISYNNFIKEYKSINNANIYSLNKIDILRKELEDYVNKNISNKEFAIITTGSFGRNEASEESDLDYFIICKTEPISTELEKSHSKNIENIIKKHIKKSEGDTGTFGCEAIVTINQLRRNIGGTSDSNQSLTRRMLFLLEGKSLYGDSYFNEFRHSIAKTYIKIKSKRQALPKFLLNDIIRYYRTIATDFQHKVSEANKPWGLRNIKLRFSRKILYFAGIITVAESTKAKNENERIDHILTSLEKPALFRLFFELSNHEEEKIKEKLRELFHIYNFFLEKIENPENRKQLESITDKSERYNSSIYKELSSQSNQFSKVLFDIIKLKYDQEHQIHHSLVL